MKITAPLLVACVAFISACADSENNDLLSDDAESSVDGLISGTGGISEGTDASTGTDAGAEVSGGDSVGGGTSGGPAVSEPPGGMDGGSAPSKDDAISGGAGSDAGLIDPATPLYPPIMEFADDALSGSETSYLTRPASDSISVGDSAVSPVDPYPILPVVPKPIQPGTLTAGDYDDQLNPWLYEQYSDNYLQNVRPQENIPRLNLDKRVAVVVKDSSDQPYSGATVALLGAEGNVISELVTPASGIAYLYEDLDGLGSEFMLKVDDRQGDITMQRTVTLDSISQQRRLEFKLDTPKVATTQLDLQLVIDTTGSMGDELNYLQTELSSILNNIQSANPQVSIHTGLVVYRDIGDQYVVRSYPFTDNLVDMQSALSNETFGGGGDYPEAMDQAMAEALTFNWREQSTKLSLLVADAPPHSDRVGATWASALVARMKQIHIVPLAASGVAEDAEYLMRSMAALTNSRYLFLTDDSGLGNPHSEPLIDCYIVTRLDGLITRVINELTTGIRTEPTDNEVIRQVGNYAEGVCHPDQQFRDQSAH